MQNLENGEILAEVKSDFQTIQIVQTKEYGKLLKIDDSEVFCEADEFIYHEMMAHTAINTHKEPKDVAILGGGDLGVAKEVLKHECIQTLKVINIDSMVTTVCNEEFDWCSKVLDDNRCEVLYQDGVDFIKKASDKSLDIVIVDSEELLKSDELFDEISRVLKDDGLVVTQGKSYFLDLASHKELLKKVAKNFYIAMPYRYEMLCYEGGVYSFILASKKYHPTADINLQRADLMDGLKYYNSDIHIASFAKPTYIHRELLGVAKN